jgi:hypothetical protein
MFNIWHLGEHQFILANSVKENKLMYILYYYIIYYVYYSIWGGWFFIITELYWK